MREAKDVRRLATALIVGGLPEGDGVRAVCRPGAAGRRQIQRRHNRLLKYPILQGYWYMIAYINILLAGRARSGTKRRARRNCPRETSARRHLLFQSEDFRQQLLHILPL
eukprot:6158140-Pleurochrysis_carterae.AAC.1